jgi:hypothetical protein
MTPPTRSEDGIRAPTAGRHTRLGRQFLGADDHLLRDGEDRRFRRRAALVDPDHAGAKPSSDLGGGTPHAAAGAEQQQGFRGLETRRFAA